jgi:hypothetical protein
LEFTLSVLGASNTALSNYYIAQAYIKWLAPFLTPAGKAGIWMLCQNQFEDIVSQLLKLRCIGIDHHAFGYWRSAGGRKSPYILNLNNAHATATVWSQTGMVT